MDEAFNAFVVSVLLAALLLLGACGKVVSGEKATCGFTITSAVLPDGGIIFNAPAEFSVGESVFDITMRECKNAHIQMEFSKPPLYNAAYILGIDNLYEFDNGATSGWVYSVNGEYPNVSCSLTTPADGDVIVWEYTLDVVVK